MKSSLVILSIITISISACSPNNPLPPPVSPTVETDILPPPDSPAYAATNWAIRKTVEAETTPNNPYPLETPTPTSSSSPSNNSNFRYDPQIGLYNLVDELSFQMSRDEYNEFLELQDEWESLARRQCRWQSKLFLDSPNQQSTCLDKQYRQRISMLLVLLCRNSSEGQYRANGDCSEAEKYKIFIQ